MNILNDNSCGWINDLAPRTKINNLEDKDECDWLVVGAGYTGLSAARVLAQLHPTKNIITVDAQLAGEGASGRNSGYLVDTTLNDGFNTNKELSTYKKKTSIYKLGIDVIKKFIKDYQVECELNECGKYFASTKLEDEYKLINFSKILTKLGFENNLLFENELSKKLGTSFYKIALYTKGGILLHPAKLVRAMISALPNNVKLYENTCLISWIKIKDFYICKFNNGSIKTKNIIFTTNGFLKSLGIKKHYNFPLTLTASMTRKLTDKEFKLIGSPNEWGVLPVRPMGATIRMTKSKRILIRNTVELYDYKRMSNSELKKRVLKHKLGIGKRFPQLPKDLIESSWSGVVSRSRNSSQIFEKIDKNVFVAGCYNGSGIGVGTLFGEQIAIKASNQNSEQIGLIETLDKPTRLPSDYLLNLGIKIRLIYESLRARADI